VPSEPRIRVPARRPAWAPAAAAAALLALLLGGVLVAVLAFDGGDEDDAAPATSTRVVATVPSVVGLTRGRARSVLARAGLESAVERRRSARPAGRVVVQKPKAGSRVERGVAILLIVSSGRKTPTRAETAEAAPATAETETTATAETDAETATTTTAETEAETATTTLPERPTDTVIVNPEPELSEVPGVLDVGFVDAALFVESRGYVADTITVASPRPRGIVLRQRPAPGTKLARGRTVRLYVAAGAGKRQPAKLSDYSGLPEEQARDLLRKAGFTVRTVDRAAPSRRLVGKVLFQRPAGGRSLPVLSQVTVYVGR
jgi:beta-lactam-binding protein with PASTA domain